MKIKCGRKEYTLKNGDYILDNGACLQFCPKDNSELPWGTWHRASSVYVSKKEFKRIISLPNIKKKRSDNSNLLYYFWEEKNEENIKEG